MAAKKPAPKKKTPAQLAAEKRQRAQQRAVFQQIQSKFGVTDALLDADPTDAATGFSLREAFDQIRREKITDPNRAAQIINKTTWFRNNGVGVLERIALRQSNPGVYSKRVVDKRNELKRLFVSMNLQVSRGDLNMIAKDAFEYGLDSAQVVDKYKSKLTVGAGSDPETQLRALSKQMGVMLTDNWYQSAARQVATGSVNITKYEDNIRTQAKNTYSYWADRIDKGDTVAELAGQYLAYAQQWLEDPNVDLTDRTVRQALQPADGSGQPSPLWRFEQMVKSDPRWKRTQNAQATYAETAGRLLQSWSAA